MKFAREFKAAIESGDYPEEWCHAAIPYPTLKKCLNKIRAEFLSMGLDADSLHQLLHAQVVSAHGNQIPLVKYKLDVRESDVQTHFTILVDLEDGVIVDASLSPASRAFLENQAEIRRKSVATSDGDHGKTEQQDQSGNANASDTEMTDAPASTAPVPDLVTPGPITAPIELPGPAIRQTILSTQTLVTPAGAAAIDPHDRVMEVDGAEREQEEEDDGVYDYSNPSSSTPSPPSEHEIEHDDTASQPGGQPDSANTTPSTSPSLDGQKKLQRVEVSIHADSEFFQLIYRDMAELERIGQVEQAAITAEVLALGQEVQAVAKPEQKRRLALFKHHNDRAKPTKYTSDLSQWRELFELYMDAQVFFSTRERDHGAARSSAQASRQLDWFQEQVRKRGLLQQFQLPASVAAYQHFLLLNKRLYLNLRFRELNLKAQAKILKKFDKWTALGVSRTFPDALSGRHQHDILISGMARDICARIAQDVVSVVPRLEDYTCPVCLSLAWLPVRLRCRHVFCIRCVVRMQQDDQRHCPLCRGEVVMEADLDCLDHELTKFLKLYFRKETKEKQQANDIERGVELFGEDYKPMSCVVM